MMKIKTDINEYLTSNLTDIHKLLESNIIITSIFKRTMHMYKKILFPEVYLSSYI